MKIYLSSLRKIKVCMKKIIYAMTFAGICAVGANAALNTVNGCYQIGTYDELKEFATKVNDGEHSACGKLTANIIARILFANA